LVEFSTPIEAFIYILDLFGTMAFAVTGAFKAIEHKADIVGIIILATITGVAGGTIRDVVLGKSLPNSLIDPSYVIITVITGIIIFLLHSRLSKHWNLFLKFDAIGYKMLLEILVKTKGAKVKEIPYTFTDRTRGSSKLDSSTMFDYVKSVWKLYRYGHTAKVSDTRTSVRFISKAGWFFTVGLSGLLVNYLVSLLFVDAAINFWYIHATIIGIAVSMSSNFILNKIWTFEDRNFEAKRTLVQYGKFVGFSSLGALIQLGFVYVLVDNYQFVYPLALMLAVIIAASSNFILNKKWTFKEKIWS